MPANHEVILLMVALLGVAKLALALACKLLDRRRRNARPPRRTGASRMRRRTPLVVPDRMGEKALPDREGR